MNPSIDLFLKVAIFLVNLSTVIIIILSNLKLRQFENWKAGQKVSPEPPQYSRGWKHLLVTGLLVLGGIIAFSWSIQERLTTFQAAIAAGMFGSLVVSMACGAKHLLDKSAPPFPRVEVTRSLLMQYGKRVEERAFQEVYEFAYRRFECLKVPTSKNQEEWHVFEDRQSQLTMTLDYMDEHSFIYQCPRCKTRRAHQFRPRTPPTCNCKNGGMK